MSPERQRATKGLAIHIDNPQPAYKPGGTISGRVFRQVPILVGAKVAEITIQLVGHANAIITG